MYVTEIRRGLLEVLLVGGCNLGMMLWDCGHGMFIAPGQAMEINLVQIMKIYLTGICGYSWIFLCCLYLLGFRPPFSTLLTALKLMKYLFVCAARTDP